MSYARRVDAVVDWPSQRRDFEPDGSLRDLYVFDTTLEDWAAVLGDIVDGGYPARLLRHGAVVPMPRTTAAGTAGSNLPLEIASLFATDAGFVLMFDVGGIELSCHFFVVTQIEFSFDPKLVTERVLRDLLTFMCAVGDVTRKRVALTPENAPDRPLFTVNSGALRWHPR